ncbi:hypothetical protein HRG_002631 [Hirsutella rhossiliensis]|uniref:Uncharacterized protein n=1 Tax=Hirsutella rhossiliensis TaxID=111463 RepID=A0A9P8N604_9HYPO|nr:uncharacterized protein HRG_02631 [Hirsutella rhossiliensis]KAH0967222.1 hypothetical protein HRG_02631 [Hirsutella rhossiliensis]
MWERIRTSSLSSSITSTTIAGDIPGVHRQRGRNSRSSSCGAAADQQDELLDALGIASGPSKYEIRGGKMVPQVTTAHVGHIRDPLAASVRESIHQATRQRLQQELQLQRPPPRKSWLKRSSGWRPASSVYSDADDGYISDDVPPPRPQFCLTPWAMHRQAARAPVSPPSSPEPDDHQVRHVVAARDVSPMDAESEPAVSYQVKAYRASRHATLQHASTAPHDHRRTQSGPANEPRRDHGPLKLSPGASVISAPVAAGAVSPGGRPARVPPPYLGSRVRSASKTSPGGAVTTTATTTTREGRPPWKGASGRSKILPSVADDLYVAPLNIRRGNDSTRGGGAALISRPETNHAGAASQRPRPLALNQRDVTASKPLATGPRSYPTPPDSASLARAPRPRRPRSPPPPPPSSTDWSPSSHSPALHSLAADAPSASAGNIKRKPAPPVDARQEPSRVLGRDAARPRQPASESAWVLPSSRFSVTTCATSIPDTPRQSVVPPLPILSPQSYSSSVTDCTGSRSEDYSVRATPDATTASPGNLYSTVDHAKSLAGRRGDRTPRTFATMDAQSIDGRSSILSMAKPLPLAPPELSASQDRIAQLNAYIQSLIHRRLNISKSIQQMTELMPIDSLFASDDVLRKREVEKLKVQALRDELAEIQREEYNAGLKLHRAHKRSERDAEYEQTALWVRRVTG